MLGAGGIFVVALSAYFGRLPVMFWYLVVAFATAAWCASATTFPSFMGARILNGFFSTVAQGGGLMFINDLFFFHVSQLPSQSYVCAGWRIFLEIAIQIPLSFRELTKSFLSEVVFRDIFHALRLSNVSLHLEMTC